MAEFTPAWSSTTIHRQCGISPWIKYDYFQSLYMAPVYLFFNNQLILVYVYDSISVSLPVNQTNIVRVTTV